MANKCPKCETNNPDTLKFCGECGTQLPDMKDIQVTETIETPKEELTTGSTYAGRYLILIGGVAGPGTLWNDIPFVYDVQEDRWSKIGSPIPVGATFNDSGVCITGATLYVIGGEGPRGSHFNHFLIGRIKPAR